MTKIGDLLDPDLLAAHVAAGLVSEVAHPEHPLVIYNYTHRCQWERAWDDVTRQTRGLVVTDDGEVLARPFPKFFNWGEHEAGNAAGLEPIPGRLPDSVSGKADGSLGVAYRLASGEVNVATRGSFMSDQAVHATAVWLSKYGTVRVPEGETWLFEVVYPENRIVVDYRGLDDLILLARLDTDTGEDLPLDGCGWPGPVVPSYWVGDLSPEALDSLEADDGNSEGFVLRWDRPGEPALRVKWKLSEYVRLHRILTGVSSRSVWELLAAGEPLDRLVEGVPDEFYGWVRETERGLLQAHAAVIADVEERLSQLLALTEERGWTRREQAEWVVKECTQRSLVFAALDGKDVAARAWNLVRPERTVPFATDPDA